MSASARPRGRDLRAVYTLAGECRDLGDDPRLWRARFAAGLGRLVDADLVIGGELAGFRAGRPRDLGAVEWGWDHGLDRRGWLRALELLATDPTYSPLIGVYAARDRGGRALPRRELVGDRAWRRSAVRDQVYRVIGIDHPVFCFPAVPGSADEVAGAVLGRAAARPDFTPRATAIVQAVCAAVGSLVGGPLARFADPGPSVPPPRCRQVLRCLLEGEGDKQIAAKLGLSRHTVNEYTKRVYRHFGVEGRTELLARWVRRGWGLAGGWADPGPGRG